MENITIDKILIQNFKCFDNFTILFKKFNMLLGQNNSGKTSIIQALKFLSISIDYFNNPSKFITYSYPSASSSIPEGCKGFRVPIKTLIIDYDTVYHRYGSPPALIKAEFSNGIILELYLYSKNYIFVRIKNHDGINVTTDLRAENVFLPSLSVLPQLSTLSVKEKLLPVKQLIDTIETGYSSLYFRNQINYYYDYLNRFQELIEKTWPSVSIQEFLGHPYITTSSIIPDTNLALLIRDRDFTAEIGTMGHGLQIWMQILWFLTLNENASTVVFDEPDVYLHPDLQHKLLHLIRSHSNQAILSSHSVELISEVQTNEIIVIDKKRRQSLFTNTIPEAQKALDDIGSIHNLQLTRVFSSNKCIFVEGNDIRILKCLFPNVPFREYPHISVGGWGGWNYVVGTDNFIRKSGIDDIRIYCIFDSDYHTKLQIRSRKKDARKRGINLCVLTKKEIENYLLIPSAIKRLICKRLKSNEDIEVTNAIIINSVRLTKVQG